MNPHLYLPRTLNPLSLVIFFFFLTSCSQKLEQNRPKEAPSPPNIIFILTDDHRYDAMGFMNHPFLRTPHMDRMAREGIHFSRAVVTTSLCSPSRASILTGMYAHNHGVINNYNPVDTALTFFPEYLQTAGYETAFIGKWHMGGEIDDPQRGFDHWLSFKGQGTYWADGHGTSRVVPQTSMDGYNLNGQRISQKGYITDELTDFALEWLENRDAERPFMLYLSHKAVHSDFVAADRHIGTYKEASLPLPGNFTPTSEQPMWLFNQRNSRHGAEFGYNLPDFELETYYRRYCETLLAVDENVGRIMEWVDNQNGHQETIIIYMGDNGFQFGDHGLIDKRTAYEASIRVPLLIWGYGSNDAGQVISQTVANIDIAPTLLAFAGISPPDQLDGMSFKTLMDGDSTEWREELLYEYYWERNYPYTPTTHALITDQFKFIRYQGIWDMDELYDIQADPLETNNLIFRGEYQELAAEYRNRLFALLDRTNGNTLPLLPDKGNTFILRNPQKSPPASFPENFLYRE